LKMEVVKTESGYVSGTVIGEPGNEVHIYRGIPYAAPPVGDLRWKPPQPAVSWSKIRECTAYSKIAPQTTGPFQFKDLEQSEDCLYLNVVTPAKRATEKLPVMVWFHGGGFSNSTGNDPLFNYYRLPQRGIVQVAVTMRLGVIGLMAHPLLSKESPRGVSGNYLFLDQIAALKWVQKNIAAFGGDPGNVTIFGESGGGGKVIGMMASPLAKGLFHRAIIESGGMPHGTPLKTLEERGEELFSRLGIKTLKEARALPFEKYVDMSSTLGEEHNMPMGFFWDSAVDGWFLPDKAIDVIKTGKHNAVPLIAGANYGELTHVDPNAGKMARMMPSYIEIFTGNNKAKVKGYAYIFDQVPAGWKKEGGISVHAIELMYVFGDYDNSTPYGWSLSYDLQTAMSGVKSRTPGLTAVDKKVSEAMMAMWAQFARTGDPSVKGLSKWPAYDTASDRYLYITEPLEVKSGFSRIGLD
jgi:para-nitrobenzyl esterase